MRNLFPALMLACSVCGCGTTAPSNNSQSSVASHVAYLHPNTKFSFPDRIQQFQYAGNREYDRDEKDVSVAYNSPTPVAMTVYVYPAAKDFSVLPASSLTSVSDALIDHELQKCKSQISQHHPEARLISEGPCEIIQGNNHFKGKKAVYSMAYQFGFSNRDSLSELYIFMIEPSVKFLVTERNFIEYRDTYPANLKIQAEKEIETFLCDLTWPTK